MRLLPAALLLLLTSIAAQAAPESILGTWLTANGASKIEITRCGELFCGTIAWLETPQNDARNADASLRDRPLLGVQILTDFKYEADNLWSGGKLYAPERGRSTPAKLVLTDDDTLEIRVVVGPIKRTVIWTREKQL